MSNTFRVILAVLIAVAFIILLLLDRPGSERRRDDRDVKKSPELSDEPMGGMRGQQPADLQVGEDEAARLPNRFEPDRS